MFRLKRFCLIMIIFAGLMLQSHPAAATVDVTTGFVSERKTTFISLHHEDVLPMPLLVAEVAQNVDALDNVFHRLQDDGRLLPAHPVLAIKISDDAYQRVLSGSRADGYAVLSLEKDYRLDLDPHDILSADTIGLGPVYRIELALWPISVNELFTLVLLLPQLNADNPRMELLAADIRQYRDKHDAEIERIAGEWSYTDLVWSPDGNLLLSAVWRNRGLSYQVFNFAANERISLDRLEHYILPPTFSPDSRFIVYASQTELKIVDVVRQKTQSFLLREKMPYSYRGMHWITVAFNETADSLFLSFGGRHEIPVGLLWRGPVPGQAEFKNMSEWHEEYLAEFGRSAGFGVPAPGIWSDLMDRRHASAELAELKSKIAGIKAGELTAEEERLQAIYGTFYSKVLNYPQNNRLAILLEGEARLELEARVLSLPSLKEIDKYMFALAPEQQTEIPGRIAGISLFNIIVMVLLLSITGGMTKFIIFLKQKHGKRALAPISKRKKFLLFAIVLLITLLLHFAATIYSVVRVDDNMGETASDIAQKAITQRYAGLGYTVEFLSGYDAMIGSSPLWLVDFPYQVLYWRWSGFTRFAAPIDIGLDYKVFNEQGHFVKREGVRYYVLGENRLFLSHLPWQIDRYYK